MSIQFTPSLHLNKKFVDENEGGDGWIVYSRFPSTKYAWNNSCVVAYCDTEEECDELILKFEAFVRDCEGK